jgi:UDP-4-amino-4,6-dideoxy-N-acetyl-beta-L-altrosamine transaminase
LIPYGKQSISFIDVWQVAKQLKSKNLTQGPKSKEFESAIAKYTGSKYAVAVSSATAGLHLAVQALNLEERSIVATSPISFVASSNAILYNDLIPDFIDIDENDINISLKKLTEKLEQGIKITAVIAVHFSGYSCRMEELNNLSRLYNFKIIEDAAHALGGSYHDGTKIGNSKYSDMTIFSLHPVKSITSGEGGVITTNDEELYLKLLRLRSHGINKAEDEFQNKLLSVTESEKNQWYYEMVELGFNYRLTDFQSSLAISQLKRLDKFIYKRRINAKYYLKLFSGVENVRIMTSVEKIEMSALHLFFINLDFTQLKISKNEFMRMLRNQGIGSQVHYIPINLQPYYKKLGYVEDDTPTAMNYYMRTLSIPLYPNLRKYQMRKVVKAIEETIKNNMP